MADHIRQYVSKSTDADRKVFLGEFFTWSEAVASSVGYDANLILEKVFDAAVKVKRGEAIYERDSVIFDRVQYSWPVVAGLLNVACKNNGSLRVLDFGGSLGSSYFENLAFTRNLSDLKWGVVEQSHFVARGRKAIEDKYIQFFSTIEECHLAIAPNVILLSNVLQYIQDYQQIVGKLSALGIPTIVVDRTIVSSSDHDRVFVQVVPPEIYSASYPVYSLSESLLLSTFQKNGYDLVSDFRSLSFPALGDIHSEFKGYLLQRTEST